MALRGAGPIPASPVAPEQLREVRRPLDQARLLPPHVFHDPRVFEYEQEAWFARTWICVGREEEAAQPGEYLLANVAGESVCIVRGYDGMLRAFYNVCRHRGSLLVLEPAGRLPRFQCPYHAWTYDLDGSLRAARHTERLEAFDAADNALLPVRLATWQGFVFVDLAGEAPELGVWLADLPRNLGGRELTPLRRARRIDYEVAANWKVIAENYSECYHCPGVHPQLNRLTPYDQGRNLESEGPWAGGYMELTGEHQTMSLDGARHGRPPLPGTSADDAVRIYYFVLWPNILLSLHPDYLMTQRVVPLDAERSRVVCEWFFDPATMAAPGFDPSDAVEFWDLTNRQDWAVCESQQQGTRSRAYRPGRYTLMEDMVHAFDLMVADRYAADGVTTRFAPRHDKWRAAPRG